MVEEVVRCASLGTDTPDMLAAQGRLGIVMENCPLGDLTNLVNHLKQRSDMNHELVTGLPEDLLAQIFVQILLALKQMHDLGMAHRDLKLANVYLMGTGDVKVRMWTLASQRKAKVPLSLRDRSQCAVKQASSATFCTPPALHE